MNRSMNTKTILPLLALAAMTTASQAALFAGDILLVDFGKDGTGETAGNWNNVSLPASPNNTFAKVSKDPAPEKSWISTLPWHPR